MGSCCSLLRWRGRASVYAVGADDGVQEFAARSMHGNELLQVDGGMLLSCNKARVNKARHVTIPSGVLSVGDRVFYQCTGLTKVTIPEGVVSFGSGAFHECPNLFKACACERCCWCARPRGGGGASTLRRGGVHCRGGSLSVCCQSVRGVHTNLPTLPGQNSALCRHDWRRVLPELRGPFHGHDPTISHLPWQRRF